MTEQAAQPPLLAVTRGDPAAEELAALVAVLTARARRPAAADTAPPRSQWAAAGRLLRAPATPGPGAWQASSLPG